MLGNELLKKFKKLRVQSRAELLTLRFSVVDLRNKGLALIPHVHLSGVVLCDRSSQNPLSLIGIGTLFVTFLNRLDQRLLERNTALTQNIDHPCQTISFALRLDAGEELLFLDLDIGSQLDDGFL